MADSSSSEDEDVASFFELFDDPDWTEPQDVVRPMPSWSIIWTRKSKASKLQRPSH